MLQRSIEKKKKNSTLTAYVLRLRIRKTVQGAYDYEKQNYIQQKQPPKVFCKKGILRILQNSPKKTCARVSFFNKVAGLQLY